MKIRESILKLGNYKPPLEGRNPKDFLLMDFNESPLPPPAHVIEALVKYIQDNRLQTYPAYGDFLALLGDYVAIDPGHLMLTNGSDQGIDISLRALLNEGDEMLMAQPGFAMFFQIAGTLGARIVSPQYRSDMSFPFEEIMEAVNPRTRLVVVINPNNPTGTSASLDQIRILLESFPETAILVDEAYFEFTQHTCLSLLSEHQNLIIVRTFSKAFAIPSLRLGYVIAHPSFIGQLYKIRGPYDVNMVSLVAARAQLEQPAKWQTMIQEIMEEAKPMLEQFFKEQGIRFYPGEANFMLVEPDNVKEVIEFLKNRKILVRPMRAPIAQTFRVSLGMTEQTQCFIDAYSDYLKI
ncbi:MAG: histidinol-phosphate aminotransferase family protein [SAR324 cluster bacterium]|nr:histidinol-phosphate aminotransferase family protein [SAR324 cluster bacterium]